MEMKKKRKSAPNSFTFEHTWLRLLLISFGGCVVVAALLGFIFRKSLLAVSANGADYVLRPLIGSENTLKIESVLFGLEDKVNQIHHDGPTTVDSAFTGNASVGTTPLGQLASTMPLLPVPLVTHLPPYQNEGVWEPISLPQFPQKAAMAKTLIHVDDQRSYAYVALVKIDMSKLCLGTVAGTEQPGGPIGNKGDGKVPENIQSQNLLVAAFDGGFQYRDGAYGMIVEGKTFVPVRPQLATLFIDASGHAQITNYLGGPFPANVVAARQNGPLLVQDGKVTSFTEEGKDTWGRTVTNSMYTWRSGIGETRDGSLIYAVGPSLQPQTLARALQAAGAVNAMQLDINPYWVRFALFTPAGNGSYETYSLLKNMENGGMSYLHGYQKDFFYLYRR